MTEAQLAEFSAGQTIRVAPAAIERELAALWRRVAEQGPGGRAVTRACLWNLIVYTDDEAGLEEAKQQIDQLSPRVPARVLVLAARRDRATAPVRASIEANWHSLGGGARQVGSEEVTLHADGEAVDRLAPIIRALLLPDVPTATFWLAAPPDESALSRELEDAASRWVVTEGCAEGLLPLLDAVGDRPSAPQVVGLRWIAAAPWRQLLASLFAPPTPAGEAPAIGELLIEYAEDGLAMALLTVGWIAARLGWRDDGHHLRRADGGAVAIRLREQGGVPSGLARLAVGTPTGTYAVTRAGRNAILETPSLAWKQPFHLPAGVELWTAALSGRGRDPRFLEALRRAAPLVHRGTPQ